MWTSRQVEFVVTRQRVIVVFVDVREADISLLLTARHDLREILVVWHDLRIIVVIGGRVQTGILHERRRVLVCFAHCLCVSSLSLKTKKWRKRRKKDPHSNLT